MRINNNVTTNRKSPAFKGQVITEFLSPKVNQAVQSARRALEVVPGIDTVIIGRFMPTNPNAADETLASGKNLSNFNTLPLSNIFSVSVEKKLPPSTLKNPLLRFLANLCSPKVRQATEIIDETIVTPEILIKMVKNLAEAVNKP